MGVACSKSVVLEREAYGRAPVPCDGSCGTLWRVPTLQELTLEILYKFFVEQDDLSIVEVVPEEALSVLLNHLVQKNQLRTVHAVALRNALISRLCIPSSVRNIDRAVLTALLARKAPRPSAAAGPDDQQLSPTMFASSVRTLMVHGHCNISRECLSMLGRLCTSLLRVHLISCENLDDAALSVILQTRTLREVRIVRSSTITDKGLAPLKQLRSLVHLDLSLCPKVTDGTLMCLRQTSTLAVLKLFGCINISSNCLKYLHNLVSLRKLSLGPIRGDSDRWLQLPLVNTNWKLLVSLVLRGCSVSRHFIESIVARLPQLRRFDLSSTFVEDYESDGNIVYCTPTTKLKSLTLAMCHYPQAPALFSESLEVLDIHSFQTDASLFCKSILKTRKLHTLRAQRSPVLNDRTIRCLLPVIFNLRELDLAATAITGASMEVIFRVTSLEVLNLELLDIKDESLDGISALVNLTELSLDGVTLSEECIGHLKTLELRRLKLGSIPVYHAGARALKQMLCLHSLTIRGGRLTDNDLLVLSQLANLRYLNVAFSSSLTDVGIVQLSALHCLQRLNISGTQVTNTAIFYLAKQLPHLHILFIFGCSKAQCKDIERSSGDSVRVFGGRLDDTAADSMDVDVSDDDHIASRA